jgi:Type III restriction enzyme, res subunit
MTKMANLPGPQHRHQHQHPSSAGETSIGGASASASAIAALAAAAATNPAEKSQQCRPPDAFGRMMKAAASANREGGAGPTSTAHPAAPKPARQCPQQPRQTRQNPPYRQHPTLFSSCFSYRVGHVPLDQDAAQYWHYPASDEFETRQYQVEMTEACLFHNTLVSLPTGLGKTLIASTVLYNYHLWYPTGTVVFCAPTLPLVHQQVQACGEVWQHLMDPHKTAVLTGQMSPLQRKELWSTKRIIFATPQTVHNDLEQGLCGNAVLDATRVVLLVLDEAHKATGQYSYVRIVQLLDEAKAKYRIVGLSATPGGTDAQIGHRIRLAYSTDAG